MTKEKLKNNDIIVFRESRLGCGYSHVFGKITKITKTGKYRVYVLLKMTDKQDNKNFYIRGYIMYERNRVLPTNKIDMDRKSLLLSDVVKYNIDKKYYDCFDWGV